MRLLITLFLVIPQFGYGFSLNNEVLSNQLSNILIQAIFLVGSLIFFIYLDRENKMSDWLISIYHFLWFITIYIVLNSLLYFI